MVKAVLFDLDGTLYDRDAVVQRIVADQFDEFKNQLGPVGKTEFVERILELDEHGHSNKTAMYATAISDWHLDPILLQPLIENFWSLFDKNAVLSDDTRLTLETLKQAGKRLGIITNGETVHQRRKIAGFGLTALLDVVLISEAEALSKPDPRIFWRAVERCGVSEAEAVFVGDYPEADIEGAVGAGLQAIWKRVPYWKMNVPNVPSVGLLSEILPLLQLSQPSSNLRGVS